MLQEELGHASRIYGRMDGDLYVFIFEEELPANLEILERRQMTSFSSKTMTPISFKG
jgi:hypothetical protein